MDNQLMQAFRANGIEGTLTKKKRAAAGCGTGAGSVKAWDKKAAHEKARQDKRHLRLQLDTYASCDPDRQGVADDNPRPSPYKDNRYKDPMRQLRYREDWLARNEKYKAVKKAQEDEQKKELNAVLDGLFSPDRKKINPPTKKARAFNIKKFCE